MGKVMDIDIPSLDQLIVQVNDSEICSIQRTIANILRIINDPKSSAKQLKDVIELDPPLSAKMLMRANSAYYGASQHIDEIQKAIVWLGFDMVKELALSQKVCELFLDDTQHGDFSLPDLWKHSVAVALCGKLICRREFRQSGNNLYAAGLLHELGIIIENQFLHEGFVNMLDHKHRYDDAFPPAEMKAFGYDHTMVGAWLARQWDFPAELVDCISWHHTPLDAEGSCSRLAMALYIADHLCGHEGIGYCDEPSGDREMLQTCMQKLDMKPVAAQLIVTEVKEEIARMEQQGWFV